MRSVHRLQILALATCAAFPQSPPASPSYWPAGKWRTAAPESQGIDSQKLASAIDEVVQKQLGVHSLLVIRHGYIVLDAYFYPYNAAVPHDLASVTKSITSLLTGIAVSRDRIALEQPVLSLFPEEAPENPGEQKRKITVENLLRMESGLDCGYAPGEQELEQMKRSPDWVRFALNLPMKYAPGTHSSYCSPGYHLLGSAVGAASRMTELEFGRKYLFDPLGIQTIVWADDPQGRSHGWGDCHLLPQDLARIGYLYLQAGNWNGHQIVPAAWVSESVRPSTSSSGAPGAFGYLWHVSNGPNGRQFEGSGRGGQMLIVWPELDTIVVITAGGNTGRIADLVRAAITSDGPLPANDAAVSALRHEVSAGGRPPASQAVAPAPRTAAAISGAVYEFPLNPSRLDSISLTFPQRGDARVDFTYYGQRYQFPVGLDGVYRLGPYGPFHLLAGARGRWMNDGEFLLDLNFVANINHYTLDIRFQNDAIEVTAAEASGLIRNGHLTGKRKS